MQEKVLDWFEQIKENTAKFEKKKAEIADIVSAIQSKINEEAARMAYDKFGLSAGDYVNKHIENIRFYQDLSPTFIIQNFTIEGAGKSEQDYTICARVTAHHRHINHCKDHRDFDRKFNHTLPCKDLIKTDKSIDTI
jgi:hypothetical protein